MLSKPQQMDRHARKQSRGLLKLSVGFAVSAMQLQEVLARD
jgi:hypothetical protein